jgi:hypothetical protein
MADNVDAKTATNVPVATDVVTYSGDAGQNVQLTRIVQVTGAEGSKTVVDLPGDASNGLDVDVTRVPSDPFGANADAASATGSISAKLRAIASTLDTNTFSDTEANTLNHLEVGAFTLVYNGSTWSRLKGDATNGAYVNIKASVALPVTDNNGALTVDNGGTFATQIDGAALTALQLIDDPVVADSVGFTQGTTKVVGAGFIVDDTSTDILSENDVGAARVTADRKLIVMLGGSGSLDVKGGGSQASTGDQSIMAAGGSGVYNYLQWVTVYNASSVNTYANVKDGSTVVAVLPLPAYGGCMFMPPRPIRGSDNTAWNVAAGAAANPSYFYGGGFKGGA